MKQLFVGCLLVSCYEHQGITTRGKGYINLHENQQEATGVALLLCHQTFPESLGYFNHQAGVEQVTVAKVRELALWFPVWKRAYSKEMEKGKK